MTRKKTVKVIDTVDIIILPTSISYIIASCTLVQEQISTRVIVNGVQVIDIRRCGNFSVLRWQLSLKDCLELRSMIEGENDCENLEDG